MLSVPLYGAFAAESGAESSLTLLADNSLMAPMTRISRAYAAQTGLTVNVSYASMHDQAMKVIDGEPADLLISPHPSWINQLKAQGLIDIYSETILAGNRLAFVANADSPLSLTIVEGMPLGSILSTVSTNPYVAMGDPEYLAEGIYAADALDRLKLNASLEPTTLKFRESSQMQNMISDRQAYGLIFETDAILNPKLKIVSLLPESSYPPIQYEGVVVAGENMPAARAFLDYLKTKPAADEFRRFGFQLPVAAIEP